MHRWIPVSDRLCWWIADGCDQLISCFACSDSLFSRSNSPYKHLPETTESQTLKGCVNSAMQSVLGCKHLVCLTHCPEAVQCWCLTRSPFAGCTGTSRQWTTFATCASASSRRSQCRPICSQKQFTTKRYLDSHKFDFTLSRTYPFHEPIHTSSIMCKCTGSLHMHLPSPVWNDTYILWNNSWIVWINSDIL